MGQAHHVNRPSWRGVLLRELIALGVRTAGGDILAVGKKYGKTVRKDWHPPRGYELDRILLPENVYAEYLMPRAGGRRDAAILHIHGGGYTLGYLPVFQRRTSKLSRAGGDVPVLSLDYRVAPEHRYPAALDDAVKAVAWLKQEKGIAPESVIAIGESAGAGLALALAMRLRDSGLGSLRALVLMSPWTDLTCRGESFASRYRLDPLFGRIMPLPSDEKRTLTGKVYAGEHDLTDPYLSPVYGDFANLPPMLIHVGEYEMLYDDAAALYKKASQAGLPVQFKIWPGMFHAFQLADGLIPEARAAWREIGDFMKSNLSGISQ